jgi:hypothetical protein
MVQYTNPELTDMVLIYGEALSNAGAARRLYMERFPGRQVPCERSFVNAVQHLRDYGTFSPVNRNRGRSRSRRLLDLEPEILQVVEEEPNVSGPRLALRMGVSSFTIWRTLHKQGLHPYHLQRVQHLKPEDPPRRIAFCQWLLQKIDEEPNFLRIVLTRDEAGFTRDGVFNSHNTHIWSEENPHQIRERGFQQRFSINVWESFDRTTCLTSTFKW